MGRNVGHGQPQCLGSVALVTFVTHCLYCPCRNSWSFQKFLQSHSQRRSQVCCPCTALASHAPVPCNGLRPCPSVLANGQELQLLGWGQGQLGRSCSSWSGDRASLEWGQAQLGRSCRSSRGCARCSVWSLPWGARCVTPAAPVPSCTCPETPHSIRRLHREFLPCLRQARLPPTAPGQSRVRRYSVDVESTLNDSGFL